MLLALVIIFLIVAVIFHFLYPAAPYKETMEFVWQLLKDLKDKPGEDDKFLEEQENGFLQKHPDFPFWTKVFTGLFYDDSIGRGCRLKGKGGVKGCMRERCSAAAQEICDLSFTVMRQGTKDQRRAFVFSMRIPEEARVLLVNTHDFMMKQ